MIYEVNEILNKGEEYLKKVGVSVKEIEYILDEDKFQCTLAIRLPEVCILKENRSTGSRSKQYHIHFTGDGMKNFYSQIELQNAISSTEDIKINIRLINKNLIDLQARHNNIKNNDSDKEVFDVIENGYVLSNTVKKISVRNDLSKQVQLSKIKYDGNAFSKLRTYLFPGDLLLFYKYNDSDEYLVVGIPSENADGINFSKGATKYTEIAANEENKKELSSKKILSQRKLKEVTADTIAETIFNDDEDDDEFEDLGNYSDGKKKLRERTERHQKIVKKLAKYLEACGFTIYESAIDCLAIKNEKKILVFEIKTLEASEVDERKQIRRVLSQLCFYEEFRMENYKGLECTKIGVFERKIDDKYIAFLRKYNIEAFWYMGDQLCGSNNKIQILND
ncbi:hypothetical protein [Clostridium sp. CF012]|uniref:hypothetical protein n=1 Tax=Clostridium sp. CF012 TaxID=2843319 RepID=UPI001C0BB486|nr:hypothetical protein [Clostridium sp. CF012]MBU3144623.1 hypothetical protein [Clostridium sp. CF012]